MRRSKLSRGYLIMVERKILEDVIILPGVIIKRTYMLFLVTS